MVVYYRLLSCG